MGLPVAINLQRRQPSNHWGWDPRDPCELQLFPPVEWMGADRQHNPARSSLSGICSGGDDPADVRSALWVSVGGRTEGADAPDLVCRRHVAWIQGCKAPACGHE